MGTYATTTTLDTLAVGTTFDTATSAVASQCITWAESEIDKMLARRYNVAAFASSVPPMVQSMTEQLAMGYFRQEMSRGGKESLTRGQTLIDRVMENLKMLANQELDLVDSNGALIAGRSSVAMVQSTTDAYTPTFAEDSDINWEVDPDKLDDITDSRE